MDEGLDLRTERGSWPGQMLTATVAPREAVGVSVAEWRITGVPTNSRGSGGGPHNDHGSTAVGRQVGPDSPLELQIPLTPGFPPTLDLGDGASIRWRLGVTLETDRGKLSVTDWVDVDVAPPHVPVSDLVVPEDVDALLSKRSRVPTFPGSIGFAALLVLSMAIGLPIGAVAVTGSAQGPVMFGATFAILISLLVANWVVFGHADKHPFTSQTATVRRGDQVTILLDAPDTVPLSVSVTTLIRERGESGLGDRSTSRWVSGPQTQLSPGSVSADVIIPGDLAPTVQGSGLRVDHWIRVQRESSADSDQRFMTRRSDRPLFVTA